MKNILRSAGLAFRIWFFTSLFSAIGFSLLSFISFPSLFILLVFICCMVGSAPVFILLIGFIYFVRKQPWSANSKASILFLIETGIAILYSITSYLAGYPKFFDSGESNVDSLIIFALLLSSGGLATLLFIQPLRNYFNGQFVPSATSYPHITSTYLNENLKYTTMQTQPDYPVHQQQSNKILFKGLVTGGLILLMLIPTIFISNLISEREERQKQVVTEVSARWASAQTIAGPYLVIPYKESAVDNEGKPVFINRQLIVLSKKMIVKGNVMPESRPRSIYKVLLYKSALDISGNFAPQWPADIDVTRLEMNNARVCFGLSDFKGIEEEIHINFNGQEIPLTPGLPINEMMGVGLSAPVSINLDSLNAGLNYSLNVKLKGSEKLHFMPLSANSSFEITSTWPSPSFDGNSLPNERQVNKDGFSARWNYNQANLPFGNIINKAALIQPDLSFGVSMVQPADQYNKTMRSVKYAVLIIGLTFALFFIIELMQNKPFHPVQYVLVGLALVIFYTLLLSISEYLIFDYAYLIAAVATIVLITLYSKSHFQSIRTAAIFASVLSFLYGFIFVLLRLEDTALLVGSIGLFIVLAVVMYVSRKVNWYSDKIIAPAI